MQIRSYSLRFIVRPVFSTCQDLAAAFYCTVPCRTYWFTSQEQTGWSAGHSLTRKCFPCMYSIQNLHIVGLPTRCLHRWYPYRDIALCCHTVDFHLVMYSHSLHTLRQFSDIGTALPPPPPHTGSPRCMTDIDHLSLQEGRNIWSAGNPLRGMSNSQI